jgi:hypothetical protein
MAMMTSVGRHVLAGLLTALPCAALLGRPAEQTGAGKALPDGVYLVLRRGAQEKEVRPARAGEVVVPHRHRYLKEGGDRPAEYLALHRSPEVPLALAARPEGVKDKDDPGTLRIYLQLTQDAAGKLARLTREQQGKDVAILVGGEVVTTHKIRTAITDGKVQISCCAKGACEYLLKRLESAHQEK